MKRKPITVTLDRERTLKYTLSSLCLFEEKTGVGIGDALKTGKMNSLRLVIWAGLIHEDPALTPEQVGDLIDMTDMQDIMQHKIPQALAQQVESPINAGANGTPAASEQPTGVPSGQLAGWISGSPSPSSGI